MMVDAIKAAIYGDLLMNVRNRMMINYNTACQGMQRKTDAGKARKKPL